MKNSQKTETKYIQVFLTNGPDSAELSDAYKAMDVYGGCLWLTIETEPGKDTQYMIPLTSISQVRFWKEKE